MLSPAFDNATPPQRRQHFENLLPYQADTTGALVTAAGNDQNLFGLCNLSASQPRLRTCARFDCRRKRFSQVEYSLCTECCFIQCIPERVELWLSTSHRCQPST